MNFRKVLPLLVLAPAVLFQDAGAVAFTARHHHTATLLPDGNILVTGGRTGVNTVTGDVQMYDMSASTFTNWGGGGALDTPRSSHTATLMSDGRVLIAGGFNSAGAPLSSLEICNPVTSICAASGAAMSVPRGGHTATLLTTGPNAGRVLICGGQSAASPTSITASCDIFSPTAGTISPGNDMNSARAGHTAVLVRGGGVFVAGGRSWDAGSGSWLYQPTTEMYDPALADWTPKDNLLQGRVEHSATVLNNGVVVIAGGYNSTGICSATLGECWTAADSLAWGTDGSEQDLGNHGYLDGNEFFDQNGGRTIMAESSFGVMPHRARAHSAVLSPSGEWEMSGGYGGITRTIFSDSYILTSNTVFYLTKTSASEATINASSVVEFPLVSPLARAVSGRFVDADAFFAQPLPGLPSVAFEDSTSIYLTNSRAILDGLPVSYGVVASPLRLLSPQGTVSFPIKQITSGTAQDPTYVVTSSIVFSSPLDPNVTVGINPSLSTVNAQFAFELPKYFRGIRGTASILGGTITDLSQTQYNVALNPTGSFAVNISSPLYCSDAVCVFRSTASFTISGNLTNTSASPMTSPLNAQNGKISLILQLAYTADEIRTLDLAPTLSSARSDAVVREMVFSTSLRFNPKTNLWTSLSDTSFPPMSEPVFNHTALLTPAADVMIMGGRNCETAPSADCLRSAKTFRAETGLRGYIPVYAGDDGDGEWPASEKLNTKRAFHTSTMLLTGQILTCGGSDGANPLSSCELMDPATKKWSPTGSMISTRSRHTATLLPNGNVLVSGGSTASSSAVNTAELYYTAAGRWSPLAPMAQARQNHTATLLPDGNVLMTGGSRPGSYTAAAELYIAASASWLTVGSMSTARAQHTATLLKDGDVLVAGGTNDMGALDSTERYSFAARTFSAGPDLNTPRYAHTANLLRDGKVLVAGGSDNYISGYTAEIYDGASWTYTPVLTLNRTNHRTLLLPNGKIMLTGGENAGASQSRTESYDPDNPVWYDQGVMNSGRSHHTTVLTRDNYVLNIGGWDGSQYLDTTDMVYFLPTTPDANGWTAAAPRQPEISTATRSPLGRGERLTLLSTPGNFHGMTEASGGAGAMNASHSNPRVYLQQIDNPSGFMLDVSDLIYSLYGGPNTNWNTTLSSITVILPSAAGELPYGYYHLRAAANAQFSEGCTVQISIPRPTGLPDAPTAVILGATSVQWTWGAGTVAGADGFAVFAASNSVYLGTAPFGATATFLQTGLRPNSAVSIKVGGFNLGGYGGLRQSATYYTDVAAPTGLSVDLASFETVTLSWNPNGNSGITYYEVSMSVDNFATSVIPIPFTNLHTSTSATLNSLQADVMYYFRVRAQNGGGNPSLYDRNSPPYVSTRTVGNIRNLTGLPVSPTAISWSWAPSAGTPYYEIYDVSEGTDEAVWLASTSINSYTQTPLNPNRPYAVAVNAAFDTAFGTTRGPTAVAPVVYTLAVTPLPGVPETFTNITTGSVTMNWIANGNPPDTHYVAQVSLQSDFSSPASMNTAEISAPFGPLMPNVRYYARVWGLNELDVKTDTVELGSFYTLAQGPVNLRPVEISMSGVTMQWSTGDNSASTTYELRGSSTATGLDTGVNVTYHIPFSRGFTGNNFSINGLLTSTTYYFDVAARNANGVTTPRAQAVPTAYTLAGPGGAPTGSIGGTSDPRVDSTISGVLPNNRSVTLSIPAGAFEAQTAIAVSSSATNSCRQDLAGAMTLVEVSVYTQAGAQPKTPITLVLSYNDTEAAKITPNISKLVLARYNPVSGECLPLETVIDPGARTITAKLNHFSVFQLMIKNPASDFSGVRVYPNPFYTNRGQGFLTIDNMPASAEVRIYTLSGEKVWEGKAGTTGLLTWDAANNSGVLVGSGIYLAVLDADDDKKVIKIAVER